MVFYNKAIFEENNVEVPTTWDEFVAAVETFGAAGVTPIELAGLDPWSASMPIVALASADVLGSNPGWIQDRYGDSVSFTDEEFVSAMQKERDLIEAGAYSDSALSVDYATANTNFFDGKSAMYIMGSWLVGAFPADQAADFGAFPLPTDDGSVVVPLNVGGTMSVSSKAADTEKSMAFAKAWTLAPESMKTLIETDGAFPLFKNIAFEDFGATVTPLYDDAYAYVTDDTVKVSAFGWVTNDDALPPGVADKFYALSQSLFSNADVEGQLAQLDADWDAAVAE
jgi:multiple sugar transport system substrate-binding protein/raffinose/stachyose/melibiose transport system substrate-binding protein